MLPNCSEQGDDQNEGSVIDANGEDDIGERDAVSVTRNNRSSGDSGKKTIDVERWSQDEPDKSAHSTSPVKVTITKVDSPRQSTVTVTRKSEIVMTRSTPAGERLDRYSVRVPRVDRTDSPGTMPAYIVRTLQFGKWLTLRMWLSSVSRSSSAFRSIGGISIIRLANNQGHPCRRRRQPDNHTSNVAITRAHWWTHEGCASFCIHTKQQRRHSA